jgi:uncharacterized repeat protein (TIGR01451 family)
MKSDVRTPFLGRRSRRSQTYRRKLTVESLERRELLTTVSLTPVKDNSLIEYQSPQYSGGASSTLFVGVEHFSLTRMRGLVDFNVAGSIPAGSTINSVTLTVTIELTNSTTTVTPTVELHDVLQNWGQGTGVPTAFMPPFASTTTNDTTWTNTFYPNQSWNTPGGDFSSTVSGTAVFGADGTNSTFNSSSQMVADVQSWLNNPNTNFGWLMKGDETQNSGKMIGSMHSSNPPTLTIDYTAPAAPPALTVSSSHTGNFRQGDSADQYTLTVSNTGAGPTSGQVTLTDTLPAGLTPTGASGTGWKVSISGQTVTATRSDALAAGSAFPGLTVQVGVAANAPASVTNTASVSGGGANNTNNTANDPTSITQVADLTIGVSHTGQFRQGDSADNYAITVNNVGSGPTSGQVTVTDTLPTGLTPTAANGTGWTTSISGQTVTATRSDALAGAASYPPLTVAVRVENNASPSVTNTVTVSGGGELNTSNDTSSDVTAIAQAADLTVKSSHAGSFQQGSTSDQYTITASNAGAGPTTGLVTVTDTLPAGLTPTAASGTGWTTSISGQTVTATRSDALAAGADYPVFTITVTVASNAPASVTNTVTVSGGGELNTSNDTATDPTTITAPEPDLTITNSHNGSFRQGDSSDSYSVAVSNVGLLATTGQVSVTDTLPTGVTPTAASGTGWTTSISGQTVTATRSDTLAAGGNYPGLIITVSVADNAPASVTNTATVSGGGETNTANDTATDVTPIAQAADLTVGLSHAGNFQQGDSADNYTLTVNNAGAGPTTGQVTVTDTLPSGLTPTAASGTGWTTSISGQTVTATRSDVLAAGASYPALTVTVSVASNAPASVTNTATVAGGGELNTTNDSASDPTTITPPLPDLVIAAHHSGNFRQGDSADSYTITVSNSGRAPTVGEVTVTDTLPTGLTPTAASGSGWTTSISGQTVTATRSDVLANGSSYPDLTVTVSVASSAPADVTNTASVSGGGEANTSNDTASDPTVITQVADLTVASSHAGNFQQGDGADNYTIVVSNSGAGPTSASVTVTDTVPAGLTPTAASGTGWTTSISGQTVTATRSDALANGASYPDLTITVSVADSAPASVTNMAAVSGGGELNTGNDTANDPTTVAPASGSLSGYVYIDADIDARRITPQGLPHLAIPGAVVSIFSQDSQGNWVPVAGQSPTQTGQDGSYHFNKLLAGTYQIQVTDSPNFLDGHATAGTIGGVARGTAGQDQIVVRLGAGENGTEYNFGEDGLRVGLISRRLFLASTPSLPQIIDTLMSLPASAAPQAAAAISPASSPLAVFAPAALAAMAVPTGYAIAADQAVIQAAAASSTGFTFSGAQIGATYHYSVTSDGGGTAVTGSGVVAAANQDVTGIDVSTLPDGTLTYNVWLTDAAGQGSQATATAKLDRSATSVAAAADSVFGQQSWLNP